MYDETMQNEGKETQVRGKDGHVWRTSGLRTLVDRSLRDGRRGKSNDKDKGLTGKMMKGKWQGEKAG